jgi:hypothetical protein
VADLDNAPYETRASMHLAAAGILLSPSTSPPKRSVEIPAAGHITGKTPVRRFMQAVSETGYLVTVYQCWRRLVKSFFYGESGFSMAVVWGAKS